MKKRNCLLIDCSFILKPWGPSNSLAIYAASLIKGFLNYTNFQVCVLAWDEKDSFIDELVGQKVDKILLNRKKDLVTKWRPYYRLTGFLPQKLKKEIKRRNISIVLHPFHYGVLFFFPKTIKHCAVVHDMFLYDKVKKQRGKILYYFWRKYQNFLVRKFTFLISISQATHDELLRFDGRDSKVIYNSIPFDFDVEEQPLEHLIGNKYILDVNRYQNYKNAENLIRAFNSIKDNIPHVLYLKGDYAFEEDRLVLERLVSDLNIIDRVIFDLDYRTEGEMHYLYTHADLFVSPSLKEGFGWTPIEATILKTPALVSNIEVFKEISCGKIPTFDPYSPEDIARQIMVILNNPPSEEERQKLSDFYSERYSLMNQIRRFEEIISQ